MPAIMRRAFQALGISLRARAPSLPLAIGALAVCGIALTACGRDYRPPAELVSSVEESPPVSSMTVGYPPRLSNPLFEEAVPSMMPAGEIACRRQLERLGVVFRDLPTIREGSQCGIDYPVEVSSLSGNIRIEPAATLNCQMAVAFARWTKEEFAPAVRLRYWTGIRTIHQGSSYSCRNMVGSGSHRISEHAKGNALDIMNIELDNGHEIDVRKPGFFAFRERNFLNTVRAEACDYFSTVLGPGYNYAHRNHFHFDLMERRRRSCR